MGHERHELVISLLDAQDLEFNQVNTLLQENANRIFLF